MGKSSQTKQTITEGAIALASRLGLENLSIGKLAKAVGMSKSGLFAHFQSKQKLQVEVLQGASERFLERVVRPALRAPRGEPRIRALLEYWLRWEHADFLPGGCPFIAAAAELDDQPGPARDVLVGSQRVWFRFIAEAARRAMQEGHFRPDLEEDQFAYEFYALALGYHYLARLLGDGEADRRLRKGFEDLMVRSRVVPGGTDP